MTWPGKIRLAFEITSLLFWYSSCHPPETRCAVAILASVSPLLIVYFGPRFLLVDEAPPPDDEEPPEDEPPPVLEPAYVPPSPAWAPQTGQAPMPCPARTFSAMA